MKTSNLCIIQQIQIKKLLGIENHGSLGDLNNFIFLPRKPTIKIMCCKCSEARELSDTIACCSFASSFIFFQWAPQKLILKRSCHTKHTDSYEKYTASLHKYLNFVNNRIIQLSFDYNPSLLIFFKKTSVGIKMQLTTFANYLEFSS